MAGTCTVIVGTPELLEGLRTHAGGSGEIVSFTDRELDEAYRTLVTRGASAIVLERLFAATSRGAALIQRVKADPALTSVEIRIVAHDGSHARISPRRSAASSSGDAPETPAPPEAPDVPAAAPEPAAADVVPAAPPERRRIARHTLADGTEAHLDGAPVMMIDLSTGGAQIVSPSALRPQQRVRVALTDEAGAVRFSAVVVWANFEITKAGPRYRAGVSFSDAPGAAVDAFCARHRRH